MSSEQLKPLAEALLEARCPDGTWPEPLDWLARKVLCECSTEYPHGDRNCRVCGDTGWVPFDPEALHWPSGWAYGLGRKWMKRHLRAFRPRALRYQKWYDVLEDSLNDSVYVEGEDEAIAALVVAVKAIAENGVSFRDCPVHSSKAPHA